MTAKELLGRIIKLRKTIDYRKTKIETLIEQAESTSARVTGMPRNSSADPSPMATIIGRKIDLEQEIAALDEERKALVAKFDLLEDGDLSKILTLRYVQELQWDQIMAEMGYSRSWVFSHHRAAVQRLDDVLKMCTKKD